MAEIKNKLKTLGITLAELANKLDISRPTLDTYIQLYEANDEIPKEKYQSIFERLFSKEINDKEGFFNVLDNFHNLIERDKILGTLELEADKTDVITSVIEEMKKDMYSKDSDEDIYIFINMFIRSYKREPIFKNLARYFLLLNGVKSIDSILDEEHIFLSNYYKLFYDDKHNLLKLNQGYYDLFVDRSNELKEKENRNKEKLEKILTQKVKARIQDSLSLGLDIKDLNLNKLLDGIKFDDELKK